MYIFINMYVYIYIYIYIYTYIYCTRTPPVRVHRIAELCSGAEEGSYLRLIDSCITHC